MADLGMYMLSSFSKGSERPGVITLEYNTQVDQAPVVLVGKGVTFDTGGISSNQAWVWMKWSLICVVRPRYWVQSAHYAKPDSPIPCGRCEFAAAENMPSGMPTRPGDIVTTMSGQTVEILNTDAEGRLVFFDTLTYIKRFSPALVSWYCDADRCMCGGASKVVSGLLAHQMMNWPRFTTVGEQSLDRVWRMPVMEEYRELLDSPFCRYRQYWWSYMVPWQFVSLNVLPVTIAGHILMWWYSMVSGAAKGNRTPSPPTDAIFANRISTNDKHGTS